MMLLILSLYIYTLLFLYFLNFIPPLKYFSYSFIFTLQFYINNYIKKLRPIWDYLYFISREFKFSISTIYIKIQLNEFKEYY